MKQHVSVTFLFNKMWAFKEAFRSRSAVSCSSLTQRFVSPRSFCSDLGGEGTWPNAGQEAPVEGPGESQTGTCFFLKAGSCQLPPPGLSKQSVRLVWKEDVRSHVQNLLRSSRQGNYGIKPRVLSDCAGPTPVKRLCPLLSPLPDTHLVYFWGRAPAEERGRERLSLSLSYL